VCSSDLYQPFSSRKFALSLIFRVVSTITWLVGFTAILAGCTSNSASNSPTPIPTVSSVSPEEVKNYAKAVLAMESSRKSAYTEIQKITNDQKIPDITCTKTDTITPLAKSVQDIVVNYCNQSKKIGESHGLTIPQFNAITVSAQTNPDLQRRIHNELVRLQK
jgi:hypothetical protein